ncbi:MAG: hypothetical protein H6719_15230 [Sandaracinaceae bacterium]|nr:hypothetical protein [Sandaracinaceae bacterium]
MASSSEALAVVDDELVEERARHNVREVYVENSRRWRAPRAAALNVVGYLALGIAPALPGAEPIFGVSWRLSLPLMAVHATNTVIGAIVLRRFHPLSLPGKIVEVFGTVWWIGSAVTMMAASGTARSVFWFNVGVIVTLLSNSIYNHARVLGPMVFWMIAITGFFAVRTQWGDVALCLIFGFCACYFQRLSTIYGWRLARESARVELMQERIAGMLLEQERARIERELHDGVAADLTAALWRARSLEPTDREAEDSLSARIEAGLTELRRVVREVRAKPSTIAALSNQIEDETHKLVDRRLPLEVVVELAGEGRSVDPDVALHCVRALQEALRNALTHASATRLRVAFRAGARLELVVEDDGVGVPAGALERDQGGLSNLRARASAIGGAVEWAAVEPAGTRFTLTVPLATTEEEG